MRGIYNISLYLNWRRRCVFSVRFGPSSENLSLEQQCWLIKTCCPPHPRAKEVVKCREATRKFYIAYANWKEQRMVANNSVIRWLLQAFTSLMGLDFHSALPQKRVLLEMMLAISAGAGIFLYGVIQALG